MPYEGESSDTGDHGPCTWHDGELERYSCGAEGMEDLDRPQCRLCGKRITISKRSGREKRILICGCPDLTTLLIESCINATSSQPCVDSKPSDYSVEQGSEDLPDQAGWDMMDSEEACLTPKSTDIMSISSGDDGIRQEPLAHRKDLIENSSNHADMGNEHKRTQASKSDSSRPSIPDTDIQRQEKLGAAKSELNASDESSPSSELEAKENEGTGERGTMSYNSKKKSSTKERNRSIGLDKTCNPSENKEPFRGYYKAPLANSQNAPKSSKSSGVWSIEEANMSERKKSWRQSDSWGESTLLPESHTASANDPAMYKSATSTGHGSDGTTWSIQNQDWTTRETRRPDDETKALARRFVEYAISDGSDPCEAPAWWHWTDQFESCKTPDEIQSPYWSDSDDWYTGSIKRRMVDFIKREYCDLDQFLTSEDCNRVHKDVAEWEDHNQRLWSVTSEERKRRNNLRIARARQAWYIALGEALTTYVSGWENLCDQDVLTEEMKADKEPEGQEEKCVTQHNAGELSRSMRIECGFKSDEERSARERLVDGAFEYQFEEADRIIRLNKEEAKEDFGNALEESRILPGLRCVDHLEPGNEPQAISEKDMDASSRQKTPERRSSFGPSAVNLNGRSERCSMENNTIETILYLMERVMSKSPENYDPPIHLHNRDEYGRGSVNNEHIARESLENEEKLASESTNRERWTSLQSPPSVQVDKRNNNKAIPESGTATPMVSSKSDKFIALEEISCWFDDVGRHLDEFDQSIIIKHLCAYLRGGAALSTKRFLDTQLQIYQQKYDRKAAYEILPFIRHAIDDVRHERDLLSKRRSEAIVGFRLLMAIFFAAVAQLIAAISRFNDRQTLIDHFMAPCELIVVGSIVGSAFWALFLSSVPWLLERINNWIGISQSLVASYESLNAASFRNLVGECEDICSGFGSSVSTLSSLYKAMQALKGKKSYTYDEPDSGPLPSGPNGHS